MGEPTVATADDDTDGADGSPPGPDPPPASVRVTHQQMMAAPSGYTEHGQSVVPPELATISATPAFGTAAGGSPPGPDQPPAPLSPEAAGRFICTQPGCQTIVPTGKGQHCSAHAARPPWTPPVDAPSPVDAPVVATDVGHPHPDVPHPGDDRPANAFD